jgi:hypothetical protein
VQYGRIESVDPSTLKFLGKPLMESNVREAFRKMMQINAIFENMEVTGNFLIGDGLSDQDYHSLKELLRDAPVNSIRKGAIFLSPLMDSPKKRELLPLVREIKDESQMPVYMYLI